MVEASGGRQAEGRESQIAPLPLRLAVPLSPEAAEHQARHHRPPTLIRLGRVVLPLTRTLAAAFLAWSQRPTGRFALPGALLTALVAAAVTLGAVVVPVTSGAPRSTAATGADPAAPVERPAPPPDDPPHPWTESSPDAGLDGPPAAVLAEWAREMSARTDIPEVAMQAYGYAELVVSESLPGCRLSWTTLAAIGRVESNHGRANGSVLQPDGQAVPPIIGAPLDGNGGRMHIPDTDGGALDGDPEFDRAVGPMQFIPTTWELEGIDATGSGTADINNIHDAALAAANYLCRNGRDLSTAEDWWPAILSYNNVRVYADEVFAAANDYGTRSRT